MKKITLLAAMFAAFSMTAQEVLFEDDFESYDDFIIADVGDWTLIDVDGLPTYGMEGIDWENAYQPMAFMVFNPENTSPPVVAGADGDWDARSGEKSMTSFAAVPNASTTANNDWLISPQITLGSSGNVLTFWAKATDAQYDEELFNIGISTTNTDPSSFTMIEFDLTPQAIDWEEFTVYLDSYAGETIYIGINHVASDQWGFQIDDYKVETGALGTEDVNFQDFSHFIANDQLNLSASKQMDNVSIYNALGQVIVNKSLSNQTETIDISQLQTGVYVVSVKIDGANKTFRILKK